MPLADDARAFAQKRVDEYYSMFVAALARFRGTTAARVVADFGEGRMLGAAEAVRRGMVDRVATLVDVLSKLTAGKARVDARRAFVNATAFVTHCEPGGRNGTPRVPAAFDKPMRPLPAGRRTDTRWRRLELERDAN